MTNDDQQKLLQSLVLSSLIMILKDERLEGLDTRHAMVALGRAAGAVVGQSIRNPDARAECEKYLINTMRKAMLDFDLKNVVKQ